MRKTIVFFTACLIFSTSLAITLATQAERNYQLRGYVDATSGEPLPYRVPQLGVNAELLQYSPDELERHLTWMQEANITWIRQFIDWSEFEPEIGAYNWAKFDALVETMEQYPQLELVIVFMNSPIWARTTPHVTAPPDDPEHLAAFVSTFAARYGSQVDYYQVWDEPNLDDAWGGENPNPTEYAALLSAAYNAIYRQDADATVIAAALAPTTELGGQNIADILYLQDLYALGADEYFDAVAGKPYGFDHPPTDRDVSIDTLNFSRLIALREVMVSNDDGATPLWASHWGWNHLSLDWSGDASIWGNVTKTEQIEYTLAALSRAEREWPWLGGMILHHWQPDVANDNPQWGFAVIGQEDERTTLWEALAQRPAPIAATNGLYHPRTPYARYSGLWTFGELGADIGWLETSDSQFMFDFAGSDVALRLREGNYFAFLYPRIDGDPANATPHDANGNAYLLLRSGSLEPEVNTVMVSRGLQPDQLHTLEVIADRGWDQWALVGYAVSSGNLALPYNNQMAIGWFTTFISLLGVIVASRNVKVAPFTSSIRRLLSSVGFSVQIGISIATSIAMMLGMLLTYATPQPEIFRREGIQSLVAVVLSGGLVVFQPGFLLMLASGIMLFLLIFHQIKLGLMLTLLWAPFFLFPIELYSFAFPVAEVILLLTFAAWVLQQFIRWGEARQTAISDYPLEWSYKGNTLDLAVLLWLIVAFVSLSWASRLDTAITELRVLFIEPALYYLMFRTTIRDKQSLLQMVYSLIAAGLLVSIIGLILYVRGDAIITAEAGTRRLASVYGSPNNVGLLLGRCIPFVLALFLSAKHVTIRLIWCSVLVILLSTALLTQSVGALLFGIPAGIGVVLLIHFGKRAIVPLLIAAILGVVAVAILTQVSPRFASLLDWSSGTNFIRIRVWESTLDMLSEQPLTGLGLDQFLYEFRGHYLRPDAIVDPDLSHPHNIVLDFWVRLGIVGTGILGMVLFAFWQQIWRLSKNGLQSPIVIGAIGAMVAVITHGMVDNSIYVVDLSIIFVFLLAIVNNFPLESA